MIQHTFCHLPKVGPKTEQRWWDNGIHTWQDARCSPHLSDANKRLIDQSVTEHQQRIFHPLMKRLKASDHWRIYPDIMHNTAYVDIETNGYPYQAGGAITTIALFDGKTVRTYVQGQNLHLFPQDIEPFEGLVTYNGRSFDAPFIEHSFGITLKQTHLDLRFPLHSLGMRGGLKGCEKSMGISRGELDGVDGMLAVDLWNAYRRTRDERYLQTLLAYNVEDVLHLELLAQHAFNEHLKNTPFFSHLKLERQSTGSNPFTPHPEILSSLRRSFY